MLPYFVSRAFSALVRCHALTSKSSLQIRRGTPRYSILDTLFTREIDQNGLVARPASLVFAKHYVSPTMHGLDSNQANCLCREVLEAAAKRCGRSRSSLGEVNKYSTYGCILISDVIDAVAPNHLKFGQSHWIDGDARVMDAVRQMYSTQLSALVVMERSLLDADSSGVISEEELLLSAQNDAMVGIITERDYLNAVAKGEVGVSTKVKDIMTSFSDAGKLKKLVYASPHHTALATMETMTNHRLRHIPVIGSEGFDDIGNPIQPRVLGVVSIGEVLKAVLAETRSEIHQLESYIHGDSDYSADEHVSEYSNHISRGESMSPLQMAEERSRVARDKAAAH